MSVFTWSITAANNGTADSSVNWAEGQAPSTVNDSARAMMAALARYFGDVSGALVTGGTTTAYTVTTNSGFDTLAHMGGQLIAFTPNQTNAGGAGTQVTLAVDGLTAKPIKFAPTVDIQSGTLIQGTPYVVLYNNSDGAFYLQGWGTNPYQIPLGAMLPYTAATAPNTAFVLPFGQTLSQTTYAAYYALIGPNAFGTDGGGLFNVPDLRGRTTFGLDNMGGSTAGRISTAGGNWVGTTMGANGGRQILLQSALPNNTIPVIDSATASQTIIGVNGATAVGNAFVSATGGGTSHILNTASLNGNVTQTGSLPPGISVSYILRVL